MYSQSQCVKQAEWYIGERYLSLHSWLFGSQQKCAVCSWSVFISLLDFLLLQKMCEWLLTWCACRCSLASSFLILQLKKHLLRSTIHRKLLLWATWAIYRTPVNSKEAEVKLIRSCFFCTPGCPLNFTHSVPEFILYSLCLGMLFFISPKLFALCSAYILLASKHSYSPVCVSVELQSAEQSDGTWKNERVKIWNMNVIVGNYKV